VSETGVPDWNPELLHPSGVCWARGQIFRTQEETPFSTDGSLVPSPANDFSSKWASGGFLSTAEDVVRFGNVVVAARLGGRAGDVLRTETVDLLTRVRSGAPPLAGYGLGWMSATDHHLRRVHFHFGASSGGTAVVAAYPGSGVVVAVVANLGHAKLPIRQLVNVVRPFLPWMRPDIPVAGAIVLLLAGTVCAIRRRSRLSSREHQEADLLRPVVESRRCAAVSDDCRIIAFPFSAVFVSSAGSHPTDGVGIL
jgi:CubicO group peptidase (beta-lactamase class C family)